jgi:hypothetical protein
MKNIFATEITEYTEMKHNNPNLFALSQSKDCSWFDRLASNGLLSVWMFFSVISVFSVANGLMG